jgi:phosphoglycerate dehydrogenase-like enzyme
MLKLLLMYSNHTASAAHVARLHDLSPDVRVVVGATEEDISREAPEADVFLGHRYLYQGLSLAKRLKWVQSTAAGVSNLIFPDFIRISPLLTRCPVFADVAAAHMFATALSLSRMIPEFARQWDVTPHMPPMPRKAILLGMGMIGRELSSLLRRQNIGVTGLFRQETPEALQHCDEGVTHRNWKSRLPTTDLCFSTLPLTGETLNFLDDESMGMLPPHAAIVSISREEVVDLKALQTHLLRGHLSGAALDMIPDPDREWEVPLSETPRLLITPKVSTLLPGRAERLERFIEEQAARYFKGDQPLYPVNYHNLEVVNRIRR